MVRTSKADGEITDHDIKRLIAQSEANRTNMVNKKVIHSHPSLFLRLTTPGPKVDRRRLKGTKLEVETLLVTCPSQHLSDLIKTIESAGLSVDDIVASPLATSYAVLTKQQRNRLRYTIISAPSTVSVVVFEDGLPISLEVFPIGSSHITNDIALNLHPLDEAEKIKINYGTENTVSKKNYPTL